MLKALRSIVFSRNIKLSITFWADLISCDLAGTETLKKI